MAAQGARGEATRVLVHGISGRMGQEVLAAVSQAPDMIPVGGVDRIAPAYPDNKELPFFQDIEAAIDVCHPQVVVDFTTAAAATEAARRAIPSDVHLVIGTTGISDADLQALDLLAREHGVGLVVAPNFALGAVLLIHIAQILGRYFDYAEILEAHHEAKIDAPSGTALAIAKALAEGRDRPYTRPQPEREPVEGTRGGQHQGVTIHAMRMAGRLAHHEVVLGTAGQTLSLRHDTISRECYMPGVLTAIREVVKYRGLVLGLEKLLGLG